MSGSRHRSRLLAVLVTVILVQSLALWWLIDSRVASPATSFAQAPDVAPNCPITAGAASNWGTPNRTDDFNDPSSLRSWYVYDGPGHEDNGRRTPDAISISTGLMTITGDAQGNSAGMAWRPGQQYGRWEACVRTPPGAAQYHAVSLLWPDADDWPAGGEIDFMEITDPARQIVEGYLHHGSPDQREGSTVAINATSWHSWAVEWTVDRIDFFVDGVPWWTTTATAHFPPRPMHLCLQLDNFGGDIGAGGQLVVDWVRQYPVGRSSG